MGRREWAADDTGGGLLLGLGYDARLGRNFSLVPFLNVVGGTFGGGTANFSSAPA